MNGTVQGFRFNRRCVNVLNFIGDKARIIVIAEGGGKIMAYIRVIMGNKHIFLSFERIPCRTVQTFKQNFDISVGQTHEL